MKLRRLINCTFTAAGDYTDFMEGWQRNSSGLLARAQIQQVLARVNTKLQNHVGERRRKEAIRKTFKSKTATRNPKAPRRKEKIEKQRLNAGEQEVQIRKRAKQDRRKTRDSNKSKERVMRKILSKQTRPGDERQEVKRTRRTTQHTSRPTYRSWCCCWRRAAAQERGRTRTSVWERPPPAPSSWTRTPAPPAASSWPSSPSSGASGWRLKRKHDCNFSPTDFSPHHRSESIVLDLKSYLCSVVRRWAVAPDSPSSLVLDTAPSSALSSLPGSVCPAPGRSPPPPSAGPETTRRPLWRLATQSRHRHINGWIVSSLRWNRKLPVCWWAGSPLTTGRQRIETEQGSQGAGLVPAETHLRSNQQNTQY